MGGQGVLFGRKTGATLKRPRGGRRNNNIAGHLCKEEKNIEDIENYGLISNQFAEQFDDGDLRSHVLDNGVQYSLNKHKRWAIPGLLKDNMLTSAKHEENAFEVRLVERQMIGHPIGLHSKRADCIAVHSSKAERRCRKPHKTFSQADDLISDARPSKKPKGSRKKKTKSAFVEETEDPIPLIPEVLYVVTYPRSIDSYPHFNPSRNSKVKVKSKRKRLRNTHVMDDLLLDTDEDFLEEDDIQTEVFGNNSTFEVPNLGQFITTVTPSDAKSRRQLKKVNLENDGHEESRLCPNKAAKHPGMYFGKDLKVIIQKKPRTQEKQKVKVSKQSVNKVDNDDHREDNCQDMPSICTNVYRKSCKFDHLLEKFGDAYVEGESLPRKFSVNISTCVNGVLKSAGLFKLVQNMEFWGHEVHVIFAADYAEVDNNDYNRMRLSLFGIKNLNCHIYLDAFEASLANSRIYSVSEVVDTIKRLLAVHLPESFHFGSLCVNAKPNVPLRSLISAMNIRVEVMAPHLALKLNAQRNTTIKEQELEVPMTTESGFCGICDECLLPSNIRTPALALHSCQHWFCNDCWRSHIESRLQRGDHTILCPGHGCKLPVDKLTLMSLIPADQYFRHMAHAQNRYLESNPEWYWCPMPQCGRVARVQGCAIGKGFLSCDCGLQSCLECKAEVHWPAPCQQVEQYRRTMKETLVSMKQNPIITQVEVKRCPACYQPMEKFGGCKVMTCRCGQQFCWHCLSKKGYSCNCWGIGNGKRLEVIKLQSFSVVTELSFKLQQQALNYHITTHGKKRRQLQRTANALITEMFLKICKSTSLKSLDVQISTQTSHLSSCSDPAKLQELLALTEEVLQFFFETNKILEYCCVLMSYYTKRELSRDVVSQVARLKHIVQRLEEILRGDCRQQYTLEVTESILRSYLISGKTWLKLLVHQASTPSCQNSQ